MSAIDFLIEYMEDCGENEFRHLFEEDRINEEDLANITEDYVWVELERDDVFTPDFGYDLHGECYSIKKEDVRSITEFTFEDGTDFDSEIEVQVVLKKDGSYLIGEFSRG